MLAFLGNLGMFEMLVVAVVAILIFGKNLPQAASKAYLQVRKLRNAVDDIRRESGIDREIRDIERTVREAEWEARRVGALATQGEKAVERGAPPPQAPPAASQPIPPAATKAPEPEEPPRDAAAGPTDAAS